jgi:AAA15 family ATPase/GTPase
MKIKSLQLKNFKRFTDLTLQDIPDNAKLVLLIGSNGSGKSSVFDAFERYSTTSFRGIVDQVAVNKNYYSKDPSKDFHISINNYGDVKISKKSFYGRSSFRQIPKLTRTGLGNSTFNIDENSDRPASFIERDLRFENDLEHIFGKLLKEFFRTTDDKSEIKKTIIDPINESLNRIFNKENGTKLEILEIIPPLEGKIAEINFKKGESEFHYNYLSAGEKEVFNILTNLVARGEYYKDSIFFFDEIDLHLNTKLQYNFLKEIIENWIPDNCQFWTASHSLGFIQYAKESEEAVIFDFDDLDFDYPRILVPEAKDNPDTYEIAVNKELLPALFKDYKVFFVENKDRSYYSALNITNVLFVQSNNKKSVYHKTKNGEFNGIIDRDFLTDSDIEEIEKQYKKLKILRLYSIENYLYHPENLREFYSLKNISFDETSYINSIILEKENVKANIIRSLAITRTSYSFFEEPEHNGKANQKRFKNDNENLIQVAELEKYLNNNDFDTFYKVFPLKDYATRLKERQNISKSDLAKTIWFKIQIENIIK